MKKIITILVVALMLMTLVSCDSSKESGATASTTTTQQDVAATATAAASEQAAATEAASGEKKTITIGFSWRSLDEGMTRWWDGTVAEIEAYNAGDNPYHIEYLFTNAESKVETQISNVESMIVRNPDVICIQAVDSSGSVPAYQACVDAGIPVIDYGFSADYDKSTVVFKTIDHYQAGKLQADWVNKYLEANPDVNLNVGYILGLAGVNDMTIRMNGFIENVDPSRVKVLATKNCDFQAALAQATAEDWIQAFPEMNAIVACNDEMAVGALQAFKAANIPVIALGMDGGKGALQEIADGNMSETSAFDFKIMASEGLKLAMAVATGEQKDPVYDITTSAAVMIDATNVKDYLQ